MYDFVRAQRLRDELAELATSKTGMQARVSSSVNGQLSLDPMMNVSGGIVIDGMQFNCTVWGGGGAAGSA